MPQWPRVMLKRQAQGHGAGIFIRKYRTARTRAILALCNVASDPDSSLLYPGVSQLSDADGLLH